MYARFYCCGYVPQAGKLGFGCPPTTCVKLEPSASTIQRPRCIWQKSGDPWKIIFVPSGDHLGCSKPAWPVFLMRPHLSFFGEN